MTTERNSAALCVASMTGYAAVQETITGSSTLSLELKGVNGRFLDVQIRCDDDLRFLDRQIREAITQYIGRGRIECRISVHLNELRDQTPDPLALTQLMDLQTRVRSQLPDAQLPVTAGLSIAEILRWPGVLKIPKISDETITLACQKLLLRAIAEFSTTRQEEGAKLATAILADVATIKTIIAKIQELLPKAVEQYQAKIQSRLQLAMAEENFDRIQQEITIFAMRIDIAEELTRLESHLNAVVQALSTKANHSAGTHITGFNKSVPIGKRLDFLAQELNREANSLASKSASDVITGFALELKLLIERIREQVQNIE